MKRILTTMLFIFVSAILALAQTPKPESLPSAEQIIDKYIQALGGRAAIEKITSRVAKGTIDVPVAGASGTVEAYLKAPGKGGSIASLSGLGEFLQGCDGKTAWTSDPFQGMRDLSGVELAAAKRESDIHDDLKYKQTFSKMTVTGKQKLGSIDVYVIDAVPVEGNPEKLYFDAQTGLLLRRDVEIESPQGKLPSENYLEDYREVDGVKIAHTVRQVTPAYELTIKFTEVKHNVPIDDAKFNKPAAK
ncbi:MAG: hypothetical protein AB1631_19960 [Acidobacteriota bacterium]